MQSIGVLKNGGLKAAYVIRATTHNVSRESYSRGGAVDEPRTSST